MKKVKLLAASALCLGLMSTGVLADAPAVDTYYFAYHTVPYRTDALKYEVDIESGANSGYPTHFAVGNDTIAKMLQTPVAGQLTFKFDVYRIDDPSKVVDTCIATVKSGTVTSSSCTSGGGIQDNMTISGVGDQAYSVNLLGWNEKSQN